MQLHGTTTSDGMFRAEAVWTRSCGTTQFRARYRIIFVPERTAIRWNLLEETARAMLNKLERDGGAEILQLRARRAGTQRAQGAKR